MYDHISNPYSDCQKLKEKTHTTLMLVTVMCVFLVVELPWAVFITIFNIQKTTGRQIITKPLTLMIAIDILDLLMIFSYSLDMIIYCAMNRQFRRTINRLLCACINHQLAPYSPVVSENNATTQQNTETAV